MCQGGESQRNCLEAALAHQARYFLLRLYVKDIPIVVVSILRISLLPTN